VLHARASQDIHAQPTAGPTRCTQGVIRVLAHRPCPSCEPAGRVAQPRARWAEQADLARNMSGTWCSN